MTDVIVPTWDLFIIIFICLVVGYNIIIGRNSTIKFIIASYIGAIAADSTVTILHKIFLSPTSWTDKLPTIAIDNKEVIFAKIGMYIVFLVVLAMRGGYKANDHEGSMIINFAYLIVFGVLCASLMLTTTLAFLSGGSFVDIFAFEQTTPTGFGKMLYEQSFIAKNIVRFASIIFTLPPLIMIASEIGNKAERN